MTDLLPPELFPERPVRSDFHSRAPSYALRRIATVLVLMVVVGGGVYWAFSGSAPSNPQDIPDIKADGPYKQRPEQPGGIDIPHQDVQVYQELDAKGDKPAVEHLLPPAETPNAPPATASVIQPSVQTTPPPASAGPEILMSDKTPSPIPTTVTAPAVAPGIPSSIAPTPAPAPVAAVVAAAPVPVATTVTAPVPPAPIPAAPEPAKDANITLSVPSSAVGTTIMPAKAEPAPAPAPVAAPVVAAKPKPAPVASKPKAVKEDLTIEKLIQQNADTGGPGAQAKVAESEAPVIISGKGAVIQLASVPDRASAEKDAQSLQSRYAAALGSIRLHVVRADLGAKGIYYRIQGSAASEQQARNVCASLKKSNAGCILVPVR